MNDAKEVELGTDEELNPFPRRRSAYELLKEPEDMTQEEKERLARIKAIPELVREVVHAEMTNLHNQIMALEKRYDELSDYLNGEAL